LGIRRHDAGKFRQALASVGVEVRGARRKLHATDLGDEPAIGFARGQHGIEPIAQILARGLRGLLFRLHALRLRCRCRRCGLPRLFLRGRLPGHALTPGVLTSLRGFACQQRGLFALRTLLLACAVSAASSLDCAAASAGAAYLSAPAAVAIATA
jgi:hypothetical protein